MHEHRVGQFVALRLHDAIEVVHAERDHARRLGAGFLVQRERHLFGQVPAIRQARDRVEVREESHRLFGAMQAREVLQRHEHGVALRSAGPFDQFGLLVHADHVAERRLQPVVETEAAVTRSAGNERRTYQVLLRLIEQRDELLVLAEAIRIEAEQFDQHRRNLQRAAVDAHLPVPDARNALRQQQFRSARMQFFLQGPVAQQEPYAFDQQAWIHAFLCEVAGAGGIRIADRRQVVATGQHQDRDEAAAGQRTYLAAGLDARELRHVHVEHYAGGLDLCVTSDGFLTIGGRVDHEARAGQRSFRQQQMRRIVIGDQEGRGGGLLHGSMSYRVPVPRRVSASSAATSAA